MTILDDINCSKDVKKLTLQQLEILAKEVREKILNTVFKNGGHLSSNLGVVDLIIAAHYVFDFPQDKFIFDVGHQCYAHKILTGRKDSFSTLRQKNGISGFPKFEVSEYDCAN
ncbi:MAG: 1-deoxy-D-xylulose-5-phosphate synthase N-terminal domain-containing protein, partial [Clostridia bacterium]